MYATQVKTNKKLRAENKELKARIVELETENKELRDRVEKLELIVEELHAMIFKKTKKWKEKPVKEKEAKWWSWKKREPSSYRRKAPSEDEVTDIVNYPVSSCDHCDGAVWSIEEIIRYVEDMVLPKDWVTPLKKVIKEIIQKCWCESCKKYSYWKTIPSQHSTLWSWVKVFVVYGSTVLMLSYEQIQWFLETMVSMSISDGEIAYILKQEAKKLRPEYESMKERLRKLPVVHFDETVRWVQSIAERRYGWVMSDTKWEERVYLLWGTRGWGNLETLKWESDLIGVSDNFGVYKNWFKNHQLCRAHPIRKFRDLAQSKKLNKLKKEICKTAYEWLQKVHANLLNILEEQKKLPKSRIIKLYEEFEKMTVSVENEPEKLTKLRVSLKKNKEKYFTCLHHEWVPTTNNTAERVLRPLVIKRKLCFGSKTMNGANIMEVLYSVVFSLMAKSRSNFFDNYLAL